MASNLLQQRQRQREGKLAKLERKYDKLGDHVREFHTDRADIKELVRLGDIDRDHADILLEAAQAKFDKASKAKADARKDIKRKADDQRNADIGRMVAMLFLGLFLLWLFYG